MKKVLALILALAAVFALTIGITADAANPYTKINLTLTVNGTDTQIDTKVGQKFAELVA